MNAISFLYIFIICFTFSLGSFRVYNDFETENNLLLSTNTKDNIKNPSKSHSIKKFIDPQKKIIVYANEITNECILILVGNHVDILNIKNKYNSTIELSENKMIEIIGENIINFCKDKILIIKKFNDDFKFRYKRSKRSTDRKRYQGQTQTQFVSFGSKNSIQETKNGIAEALSQPDLSRATVSGLNGMGQAQSQSSFNDCDECSGHDYQTHVSNTNSENFPKFQPQNVYAQNTKPYSGPNTFWQSPNLQNEKNNIEPPINGQYPTSGVSNIVPNKQEQEYGIQPPLIEGQLSNTHPSSGKSNKVPNNQHFGIVNEQYPNLYTSSGINNRITDKQDQRYDNGPSVGKKYPNTGTNNMSNYQDQNNQSPDINSDFGNNNLPGNLNQRHEYGIENEQIPISVNTNYLPKSKNMGNTNAPSQNTYPIGLSPFNPSGWNYPNKVTYNPNNKQIIYPDGSGFPSYPSGSGQGIFSPHNSPKHNGESIYPSNNQPVLIPSSVDSQNNSTNHPSNIPNYLYQTYDLNQLPLSKPSIMPSTVPNEYQLPWNTNKAQGLNQLNLPSLCNFLYQTCINALLNNREFNEFQKNSGLQNNGKQFLNRGIPNIQPLHYSYPSYGEKNQLQYNYGQPQSILGTEAGSDVQQSGYISSNVNPNQMHSIYGQPQSSLGSEGSSIQQSSHIPTSGNINPNKIQPNYGQQSGYVPPSGNINPNQMHSIYGQPQSSLGSQGSSIQQSSHIPTIGNINPNQIQPNYGQQSGYVPSSGNINPNQIYSNYEKPQNLSGSGGSDVQQSSHIPTSGNIHPNQMQTNYGQQSGYVPPSGNINPNQMHSIYGQPQSSLGSEGSSIQQSSHIPTIGNINPNQIQPNYGQQSGYVPSNGNINPNQISSNYEKPQNLSGSGGSDVQQSSHIPTSGNIHPNQMQTNYGQQSGYAPSSGNINPNQIYSNYEKPQNSLGPGGSNVQQSGHIPTSGNINPNQVQPNYGQQSGYVPSSGNINPNQIHYNYGQPQGSLISGGPGQQSVIIPTSGNLNPNQIQPNYGQQSGYAPSSGNINPNQIYSSYGQPQNSLGTGRSDVLQSGYIPSGENLHLNQIRPNYGQPQNSDIKQSQYGPYNGNGYLNQIQPGQHLDTLGSGGSIVQPLGQTQSGIDDYGNKLAIHQSNLDNGKMGNYPQSDNNYYRGPGSPSQNPIIGGQFGKDVSLGSFVTPIDTEGGDAQSMTNVNVDGQETSASASSQGKTKSGITQTQVSGSYAGTGMFSAQAQTSDSDKGSQSQIVSNTNGTTSTAQGQGGKGQAQSQVTYNSESGIALSEAQSSGVNYGANTQLQASIKGGLADAQSTGTGSTSSQAQIGFLPYESNNSTNQKSLFKGGGTASSQSGLYNGQSQSQLFGSYKYGISYSGAAQASSGKKLQNLPKLNLDNAKLKIGQLEVPNDKLEKSQINIQPQQPITNLIRSQTSKENILNTTIQNISTTHTPQSFLQDSSQNFEEDSEYEDNDEYYEDEKNETLNTKSTQTKKEISPNQVQNIILNLDDKHDAQITRDFDSQLKNSKVLDAGQIIPGTNGTKIPNGFRGRVASVAGDQTKAKAIPGGQAQTQTVLLTPGAGGLTVVDKTKIKALLGQESYIGPISKQYNRFQTDMAGETGKFKANDENVQYFTKSSTCGFFSFSCNYVNGAKNGTKICKPNSPPIPCQRNN